MQEGVTDFSPSEEFGAHYFGSKRRFSTESEKGYHKVRRVEEPFLRVYRKSVKCSTTLPKTIA